jgi:hypothetical protein
LARSAGRLGCPRQPLSRGSDPAGYPAKPLVSYRIHRRLSGWNLPPLGNAATGRTQGGNDDADGFRIPSSEICREEIRPITQPVYRRFDFLASSRPNAPGIVEKPRERRTRNPACGGKFFHCSDTRGRVRSAVGHRGVPSTRRSLGQAESGAAAARARFPLTEPF